MKRNDIYIVLAAILWGTMGFFNRNLEGVFSETNIIFFRTSLASVIIGIFIFTKDKNMFKIIIKDIWCFFGTGIVSLLIFNICYFANMKLTTLAVCAALLYTAPAFVIIFSAVFFKEKITIKKIYSLILIMLGCMMVCGLFNINSGKIPFMSIILGLGSGIAYALYSIFGRFALNKGYSSYTITFYTFVFAGIGSAFMCDLPYMVTNINNNNILFILGLGTITAAFPYFFYTKGLEKSESGRASAICTLEPVVAAIFSLFIFGEPMTITSGLGILVVLSGVLLISKT